MLKLGRNGDWFKYTQTTSDTGIELQAMMKNVQNEDVNTEVYYN